MNYLEWQLAAVGLHLFAHFRISRELNTTVKSFFTASHAGVFIVTFFFQLKGYVSNLYHDLLG